MSSCSSERPAISASDAAVRCCSRPATACGGPAALSWARSIRHPRPRRPLRAEAEAYAPLVVGGAARDVLRVLARRPHARAGHPGPLVGVDPSDQRDQRFGGLPQPLDERRPAYGRHRAIMALLL